MLFDFPSRPHIRRHGPLGYRDYRSFKPWLRDEFDFRCVYCLWRERGCSDGDGASSVDHLLPQSTHPQTVCDYNNLVYACCKCNSVRHDGPSILEPCTDAFGDHLEIQADGTVRPLSQKGAEQIALCRLNRAKLVESRRRMLELVEMFERCDSPESVEFLQNVCGFPGNLPRLATLRPPAGNARPDGIADSYYERKKRGEVPKTYH
jgi:hypothetical protein